MTTIVTTFVHEKECHVEVSIIHTTLSTQQIQILSGLAFILYHINGGYLTTDYNLYTLEGEIMTDHRGERRLIWVNDIISHIISETIHGGSYTNNLFDVKHDCGYTSLNDEAGDITITFKDGMLESVNDEPAVSIGNSSNMQGTWETRLWFHNNKCFRKANPKLPADMSCNWNGHYNIEGYLHRTVEDGPSIYIIENGKHPLGECGFFVNGLEVDMTCDVDERLG